MNCIKCGKLISRDDGGPQTMALNLRVNNSDMETTPETIEYNKIQLGKYTDENGECDIGLCWECKIDNIIEKND